MKVLHVVSSIHRSGGGPSRSVQGLAAAECRAGVEAGVFTFRRGDGPWVDGISFVHSGEDVDSELVEFKPDIVHLHGLWNFDLHRTAVVCRRWGIPYVVAPRGMLEPWSLRQKWLKKRVARFLYQDRDLRRAAALHATAESEAEQFRRLGFRNRVIVSPNGVNVPSRPISSDVSRLSSPGEPISRRVLFVSRMHPKKGVLELVEAWGMVSGTETHGHGWQVELVYTVSGELEREYEQKVKARVKELGLEDEIIFTGALNDDEKWGAYGRADLFVLPTHSENFGIVVAEALWAGVPVITTKGTPWSELSDPSGPPSGWWIDVGAEPLAAALKEAMSLPDAERRGMGACGHRLVEAKYTWDAVVKAMVDGYGEILTRR